LRLRTRRKNSSVKATQTTCRTASKRRIQGANTVRTLSIGTIGERAAARGGSKKTRRKKREEIRGKIRSVMLRLRPSALRMILKISLAIVDRVTGVNARVTGVNVISATMVPVVDIPTNSNSAAAIKPPTVRQNSAIDGDFQSEGSESGHRDRVRGVVMT
jgi:hypothetical protein